MAFATLTARKNPRNAVLADLHVNSMFGKSLADAGVPVYPGETLPEAAEKALGQIGWRTAESWRRADDGVWVAQVDLT